LKAWTHREQAFVWIAGITVALMVAAAIAVETFR